MTTEQIKSERVWVSGNGISRLINNEGTIPKLSKGIYELGIDRDGFFLIKLQDKFEFPYKIYGMENDIIDRVCKTYENTTGNLGVLFDGIKGTGKSVTAERICNVINNPVIMINSVIMGTDAFLAQIDQDLTIFIDEFEKLFNKSLNEDTKESRMFLSMTDGAMKNSSRRLFVFTSNTKTYNDNFIDRPGRIRYVKTFGNLDLPLIIEIVDDLLIHKELKSDTIKFISKLSLITVDIIKSIVQEVNIHNEPPSVFEKVFNVSKIIAKIDVYKIDVGGSGVRNYYATIQQNNFEYLPFVNPNSKEEIDKATNIHLEVDDDLDNETILHVNDNFYISGRSEYTVLEILSKNTLRCAEYGNTEKEVILCFEERTSINSIFNEYAF